MMEYVENDFDLKFRMMDKFVNGVLIGKDKKQKKRMLEKIQQYHEIVQLLVDKQERGFEDQVQSKEFTIMHIPDEVWLKIMTYLKIKDLLGCVSLVNKHFYNLTCDPSAIKHLTLRRIKNKTKLENAMKVLRRFKNIRSVKVTECDYSINVQLSQIFKSNRKLNCLNFDRESLSSFNHVDMYCFQNETFKILEKYAIQIETLRFDVVFNKILDKEMFLETTKMPNLKSFQIRFGKPYSLTAYEVLTPLGLNCKKLENVEIFLMHNFQFDVGAFDTFFEKTQNTLKRLLICHEKPINKNIFQNLYLCRNIEELMFEGCFMTNESFHSISQLPSLKKLKIESIPNNILESANWPSLERLWIQRIFYNWNTSVNKISDKNIKTLISNSPNLKSIHFHDIDQCHISNEVLFDICQNTNIFISFGQVKRSIKSECLEFKNNLKRNPRQLEMERYFYENNLDVFDKYQDMKNDFANWLDRDISWSNNIE